MTENTLKLDWLSFTFKADLALKDSTRFKTLDLPAAGGDGKFIKQVVFPEGYNEFTLFREYFPEFENVWEETVVLDQRSSFYEHVLMFNDNIRIQYDDQEYKGKGVNISVPSHGLEWLFNVLGVDPEKDTAVPDLLSLLLDRGCQLSRIDLAYDDFSKEIRPKQYLGWWFNGQITTKFHKVNLTACMSEVGHTFYLGSRSTGKMLRIYDKDIESKGEVDCVRYEFELHSRYAQEMCDYIIKNGSVNFVGYLRSYFNVVVDNGDTHKSRRPILPLWFDWLKKLEFNEQFVKIPHYKSPVSLDRLSNWINHYVMPSLHAYVKAVGSEHFISALYQAQIPEKYKYLLQQLKS